jgi:hypothetical protein
MTALREAAQAALEALESLQGGCTDHNDGTVEAITVWCPEVIDALRAALADAAPAPADFDSALAEYAAACVHLKTDEMRAGYIKLRGMLAAPVPQGEPVAWICKTGHGTGLRAEKPTGDVMPFWTPLYTRQPAPTPQPYYLSDYPDGRTAVCEMATGKIVQWVAQPLTDKQIDAATRRAIVRAAAQPRRSGVPMSKHTPHTPGPWDTVCDNGGNPWVKADVYWIAQCLSSVPPGIGVWESAEANARLIAAAPDLLAALEKVWAEGVIPDGFALLQDQVCDAIAKAEGAK